MARMEFLADDLDGKVTSLNADVQAREFDWLGDKLTMDLGPDNWGKFQTAQMELEGKIQKLRDAFAAKWLTPARPVDRPKTAKPTRGKGSNGGGGTRHLTETERTKALAELRAWVAESGAEISPRGRINGAVQEAYERKDRKLIPGAYFPNGVNPHVQPDGPAGTGPGKAQKAPQTAEPTFSDQKDAATA